MTDWLSRFLCFTRQIVSGGVRHAIRFGIFAGTLLLLGCDGSQSALEPAGREAEQIARLFWWMAGGAVVVWLAVLGLGIYAVRVRAESVNERRANQFIVIGEVARATRYVNVLLGAWIIAAPLLLSGASMGAKWNDVIVGALVILLSVRRGPVRERYASWNKLIV